MRTGDTFAERQRARAERDVMIRDWQIKSDALYRAPRQPLWRRIGALIGRYPGSLAEDLAGVLLIFFLTWVGLVLTGAN